MREVENEHLERGDKCPLNNVEIRQVKTYRGEGSIVVIKYTEEIAMGDKIIMVMGRWYD